MPDGSLLPSPSPQSLSPALPADSGTPDGCCAGALPRTRECHVSLRDIEALCGRVCAPRTGGVLCVRACGCCVLVLNLAGGRTQPPPPPPGDSCPSGGCQAAGREQLSPETGATERRSSFQSPCVGLGNTLTLTHTLLSDHSRIFFFLLASSGTLFLRTAAVASLKAEVSVPIFSVWVFCLLLFGDGWKDAASVAHASFLFCFFLFVFLTPLIAPNYAADPGRSSRAASPYLPECLILNFILRSLQSRTETSRCGCPELEEAPLICN